MVIQANFNFSVNSRLQEVTAGRDFRPTPSFDRGGSQGHEERGDLLKVTPKSWDKDRAVIQTSCVILLGHPAFLL